MIPGVLVPCIVCGEPSPEPRCIAHARTREGARQRGTFRQRAYDGAWDRLSKRARKLQPFCLDCGSTANLTADHLPAAWARKERGLPIRLQDVEVVCRDCNARRGESRPGSRRYVEWQATRRTP
jgi:5-methylcytosine-specific restriction endonuclease McrA